MPNDPIGARPSSTLSPDSRPGREAAGRRCRRPRTSSGCRSTLSLRPITCVPNRITPSAAARRGTRSTRCRATVSHSTRSPARRATPATISPNGLQRDARCLGDAGDDVRECGSSAPVPTIATATTISPTIQQRGRAQRVEEPLPMRRAEDDRGERAHLEQAVRARQIAVGQDLREDAVFRRAEERRLRAIRNSTTSMQLEPAGQRRRTSPSAHRDDLERLRDDQHGALAVDVGELSRVAGEQQERQDEDDADQRQLPAGVRRGAAACTASIETTILKTLSLKAPRNCVQRNGCSPRRASVSR